VQINHKKLETKKYPPTFLKKAIKTLEFMSVLMSLVSCPHGGSSLSVPPMSIGVTTLLHSLLFLEFIINQNLIIMTTFKISAITPGNFEGQFRLKLNSYTSIQGLGEVIGQTYYLYLNSLIDGVTEGSEIQLNLDLFTVKNKPGIKDGKEYVCKVLTLAVGE
jgi:hypothetical protein